VIVWDIDGKIATKEAVIGRKIIIQGRES